MKTYLMYSSDTIEEPDAFPKWVEAEDDEQARNKYLYDYWCLQPTNILNALCWTFDSDIEVIEKYIDGNKEEYMSALEELFDQGEDYFNPKYPDEKRFAESFAEKYGYLFTKELMNKIVTLDSVDIFCIEKGSIQ